MTLIPLEWDAAGWSRHLLPSALICAGTRCPWVLCLLPAKKRLDCTSSRHRMTLLTFVSTLATLKSGRHNRVGVSCPSMAISCTHSTAGTLGRLLYLAGIAVHDAPFTSLGITRTLAGLSVSAGMPSTTRHSKNRHFVSAVTAGCRVTGTGL